MSASELQNLPAFYDDGIPVTIFCWSVC